MIASNASHYRHLDCLVPNLPQEIQRQVLDITNYVVRPLEMLLAIISSLCNTFVCVTVARTRSLQHTSMLMLCSLSVTDLIYSQFSLFMNIETLTHEHMCPSGGPEKSATAILCHLATLGSLAVISIDRYLAVTKPLWHRNRVTKSRAIMGQCIAWLISVVVACFFYVALKLEGAYLPLAQTLTASFYCICLIAIICSYLGILCKKPNMVGVQQIPAVVEREKRMATTIKLILLALLFTFLPGLVYPIYLKTKGIDNLQPYGPFISIFLTLNTCLNPLLNLVRNKEMRRALKVLFRCSQHLEPPPPPPEPPQQQQLQQQTT